MANLEIIDPSRGFARWSVPSTSTAALPTLVSKATQAAAQWKHVQLRQRCQMVRECAEILSNALDEIDRLDAEDGGNPMKAMRVDVRAAIARMYEMASSIIELTGSTRQSPAGSLRMTTRSPYGVVARIVPYNHPALFAITAIAGPVLAGNAVMLKPAETTPRSALRIAEFFGEVLPEGLVQTVVGGPEIGQSLVKHPAIDRIAFTGSTRVGQAIQRDAAEAGIKQVALELGGKNAMIICDDADLDGAVSSVIKGMNLTTCAGQSCGSTSRIFVPKDHLARFVRTLHSNLTDLVLGDPFDPQTDIGPLISEEHLNRVMGGISDVEDTGVEVYRGAPVPDDDPLSGGYFMSPVVIVDPPITSTVASEELFAPVICVFGTESPGESLQRANDSRYGLTASVWSNDLTQALAMVDELDVGFVWVNESADHCWGLPFGGWKQSGVGTEESLDELLSYTRNKSVQMHGVG